MSLYFIYTKVFPFMEQNVPLWILLTGILTFMYKNKFSSETGPAVTNKTIDKQISVNKPDFCLRPFPCIFL